MPNDSYPSEKKLKQLVKQLKREHNIKTHQAYEMISQQLNKSNWREFKPKLHRYWQGLPPAPAVSLNFVDDDDVDLTDEEFDEIANERNKDLAIEVKQVVEQNKAELIRLGVEFSVFEPTNTGLTKSIFDATAPVRAHFKLEQFHYYDEQNQGQDFKIKIDSYLLLRDQSIRATASLYRPNTKNGDPRMWFSGMREYSSAGDQIAIVILGGSPYLINISTIDIAQELLYPDSLITQLLHRYVELNTAVSKELLDKLKILAQQPFPAQRSGDTAIGYTLEALLGIAANSSKLPDYKGIELKAGRGTLNRSNLFAQVADWDISPYRSSADILDAFGYQREIDFKLYCTVRTQRTNPQGLYLKYNAADDQLEEWHESSGLVAIWPGQLLRSRLLEKHTETFWVEAESSIVDGVEHFQLKSVVHTKKPIIGQLLPLLESGVITMDHLIKRSGTSNRVSEKGPLFKIDKRNLNLLFPEPSKYSLL